jgi:hypothetical protein
MLNLTISRANGGWREDRMSDRIFAAVLAAALQSREIGAPDLVDRNANMATFGVKQERYQQRLKSYSKRMRIRKRRTKPLKQPEGPSPFASADQ